MMADTVQLQAQLFEFLQSLRQDKPQVQNLLMGDAEAIQALFTKPAPELTTAYQYCLEDSLNKFGLSPAEVGSMSLPPQVWGLVLAALNCLAPTPYAYYNAQSIQESPLLEFNRKLIHGLPPARSLSSMLAYHAVLGKLLPEAENMGPDQKALFSLLVEYSPLTALFALDVHTPFGLGPVGKAYFSHWPKPEAQKQNVWTHSKHWLEPIKVLLSQPRMAKVLQNHWLELPENRMGCRNLGLLLELLRQSGDQYTDYLLEFYEAYEYLHGQPRGAKQRSWAITAILDRYLQADGAHPVYLQLNRWGSEYFMKFVPLLTLVKNNNGLPIRYQKMSWQFVRLIGSYLDYANYKTKQNIHFESITFEEPKNEPS